MTLKYVWKNFRRRKVRTILMVLSLLVSTGLIVALNATGQSQKLLGGHFQRLLRPACAGAGVAEDPTQFPQRMVHGVHAVA